MIKIDIPSRSRIHSIKVLFTDLLYIRYIFCQLSKSSTYFISKCGNENKQQPQATIEVHTLYNSGFKMP